MPVGQQPAFIFMNKESFAKLPAQARQAIDRFSGEPLTKTVSKAADDEDDAARAHILAEPGQTNHKVTRAEFEKARKMLAPMADEWVAATPDGAKVLAAFRAEIAKIEAGK